MAQKSRALLEAKKYQEALPSLMTVASGLREEYVAAMSNCGQALGELGHTKKGLAFLDSAIAVQDDYLPATLNRGILRMQDGRMRDAIGDFDAVIGQQSPKFNDLAHFGRAFANLVLGNLKTGFVDYEHRKKAPVPDFSFPAWDGSQDLNGKTILVIGEQGLGDNIMFLRYVPLLKARGARVVTFMPPSIEPMAACIKDLEVMRGDVQADYWVRVMSLAYCFGTDLDSVPPPAELDLPKSEIERWTKSLSTGKVRIGLCWSGSKESTYDSFRSIPLRLFAPLFDIPSVEFYSLQKEVRETDKEAFDRFDIYDVGSKFNDFADCASFVAGLDLVVTCDTSIAHLAGTVGVPTWVMLTSYRTYWLWIEGRTDCPWYPSARAFRQEGNDWSGVIENVKREIDNGFPF